MKGMGILGVSLLGTMNLLYSGYSKVNSNQLLKEAIKVVVQFQEEQIKQWESLSIDITALKQGPLFSAKIFLSDATKEHRNEKECRELIEKAKEKFIDALGILEAKTEKWLLGLPPNWNGSIFYLTMLVATITK